MRRLVLLAAAAGALIAPTGADAHSLVRVNGPELAYISADATSLNTLTARVSGGDFELRDDTVDGGSDPGPCRPGAITPDANAYIIQVFCERKGITRARVDLGEREDTAKVALPVPVTLLGGPGADLLTAGPAADRVDGGEGNDRLRGAGGGDELIGGPGVDEFDAGAGDDRSLSADGLAEEISCGAGQDRAEADTLDRVAGDCESITRTEVAPPPESEATGDDRVAPVVEAGGSTLQRIGPKGTVRLVATTSERGVVSASGQLVADGLALPVRSDRRRIDVAGGGAVLTVKVRGRALREARRVLRRGKRAFVRLGVVATDAAGNSAQTRAPRIALALPSARAVAAHPEPGDNDGDGVKDEVDNCINIRNGDQRDTDGDRLGDACDEDSDGDGYFNDGREPADNCPQVANPDQSTNPCLEDPDGDSVPTYRDNCFDVHNPDQRNNDLRLQYGDAEGDACDPDDDGDGRFDAADNCPLTENPDQTDADGDGLGYMCDADDTPNAAAGGGGPAGPEADKTAPRVSISSGRRQRLATVEGGLVVRLTCSEACAGTVQLTAGRALARRLGASSAGVLGRGAARLERSASTYAFVRLPKAVKRKIWKRSRTRLTLRAEVVDRAQNVTHVVRTVTLVR